MDPSTDQSAVASPLGPIHFTSRLQDSGIDFVHVTGDSKDKPFPAANGSGIAAFDFDQDGLEDLYFATGNAIPVQSLPKNHRNRLYRNRGHWKFREATSAAGVGHNGFSAGLAVGDYDGDGFSDLYVSCFGPNVMYHNEGDGTLTDVTATTTTGDDRWGTSAAFIDYDGDGNLDLYSSNYAKWTPETALYCGNRDKGHRMFCGPTTVPGESSDIYRNEGDGRFSDASQSTTVGQKLARGQGVLAADLNADGWTDLYVGNDQNPNFLFFNERNGAFREDAELVGAAYDRSGKAMAGMGVTIGDATRDGALDLFVTNYENEENSFYENDGACFFQETTNLHGLGAGSRTWIGWGTTLADFDLDGWLDIAVINGHTDNNLAEMGRDGSFEQPAHLWRNSQGKFQLVENAGPYFQTPHPGRTLALADFDNDGDWDLACGHQDKPPQLLCNEKVNDGESPSVWLTLIGREANREAIGATLTTELNGIPICEPVIAGGSYLSSSQRAIVLATGGMTADATIPAVIQWPGGMKTTVTLPTRGRCFIIQPFSDVDPAAVLTAPSLSMRHSRLPPPMALHPLHPQSRSL